MHSSGALRSGLLSVHVTLHFFPFLRVEPAGVGTVPRIAQQVAAVLRAPHRNSGFGCSFALGNWQK